MEGTGSARRSRKKSYTRRGSTRGKSSESSFKEKFVMQCIISGFIFLSVLIITLIDSDITRTARTKIKSAISSDVTIEELNGYLTSFMDTVTTIFGDNISQDANVQGEAGISAGGGASAGETDGSTLQDFRIDEDILALMNYEEDMYLKNVR